MQMINVFFEFCQSQSKGFLRFIFSFIFQSGKSEFFQLFISFTERNFASLLGQSIKNHISSAVHCSTPAAPSLEETNR
jgi:hypothetical protein